MSLRRVLRSEGHFCFTGMEKSLIFKFRCIGMFVLFLDQNFMRNSNMLLLMQMEARKFFSIGLLRENKGKRGPDFGFLDVKKKSHSKLG